MIPHGRNIYNKASNMANSTICTYPQSDDALSHQKCVLWCCAECPYINLTYQKTDKKKNKQHPQYSFTFITSLHVVLLMVEFY